MELSPEVSNNQSDLGSSSRRDIYGTEEGQGRRTTRIASVYGRNMFGFCNSRGAAVEELRVSLIDPTTAECEDSVETFNGAAMDEMNGKNKNRARKMGLSHLGATVTRANQRAGQANRAGFRRAIEEIIPTCVVHASGFLRTAKRVFSSHKGRMKNASNVPLMCIAKRHKYEANGRFYTIPMAWILNHELMPGDHIDVPSAPFNSLEIHVYPKIAGEYPFDMYRIREQQIVYPNGVKAIDVAGSIDYWHLKARYDVALIWKGKVITTLVPCSC